MKLFALLCLVGVAAASVNVGPVQWQSGKEYHFDYSGRMLTGIPELNSQYSGMGIKCQVNLVVGQNNKFSLNIRNARFVRINQVLHASNYRTPNDDNWRKLELPSFSEIPEEYQQALQSPVVFQYAQSGSFESVIVDQNEPEWSVNFKKALIAVFQTQYNNGQSVPSLDSNQIEGSENEQGEVDYWKVREESLDGICDVTYQINQIPSYMIKEQPEIIPSPQLCGEDSQHYELIKTRDVSSCSKRTSFSFYKPGQYNCGTGNCKGMWSRSSITRYTACGNPQSGLRVQSIVNEGELIQNLLGYNTEKFLTGTQQKLSLKSESLYQKPFPEPRNQIQKDQLFYEYDVASQSSLNGQNGVEGPLVHPQQLEQGQSYKTLPRNMLTTGGKTSFSKGDLPSQQEIMRQLKELFQQVISHDLVNIESLPQKQITMKALSLARGFSVLERSSIEQLYQQLQSQYQGQQQQTFRNVFFDTCIMGGSTNNVLFVKDQIKNGQLSFSQQIAFWTFLPHYVVAPTHNVLNQLFELVQQQQHQQQSGQSYLFNHAVMSFTTLVQKACVADNRQTSYPTYVFGDFCSPDSEIVTSKLIPFLQRQLEQSSSQGGNSERRDMILVTLGLLSHKNVIPVLVPFVENRQQQSQSQQYSRFTRFLATYALGNAGRKHVELVGPVLFAVFNNQAESTEVRIAAFNTLLRVNPSMTMIQRIGSTTWQENDQQVLLVVNTAFYTLSQEQDANPNRYPDNSLQRKCWLVYPIIKQTEGKFPTSGSIYESDYMSKLGVGWESVSSWISNKNSIVPQDMYGRIVYYLDQYQFTPIEAALRIRGGENLVQQIIEIVNPSDSQGYSRNSQEQSMYESIKSQVHQEWREIVQKLKIESRQSQDSGAALFVNLFEDSPMFSSLHASNNQELREKLSQLVSKSGSLKELLSGQEQQVNFQRMFNFAPAEYMVPSEMGFPIITEIHMPVTTSVVGSMSANANDLQNPKLNVQVKTLYASQFIGWVGTNCPFSNQFVATGIDEHSVVTIPAEFDITVNPQQGRFEVLLKAQQVSRPLDLVHFHIRPYTVAQKNWSLQPMTLCSGLKPIQSRTQAQTISYQFGDYLGLGLRAIVNTESAFADFGTVLQKANMYNYNPLNALRFGWTAGALSEQNTPSLRKHEIQLRYDGSASSTNQIRISGQVSVGEKQQGESIKMHKVVVDQTKPVLPYKIVKKSPEGQHEQKAAELIRESGIESGQSLSAKFSVALIGGSRRQRTWSYSATAVSGSQNLEQKWNAELESEHSNSKVCVSGSLRWPANMPTWKLHDIQSQSFQFRYQNSIRFGQNCQEGSIKVEGTSQVSEKQKEFSKTSPEAKRLEELKQKGTPLPEIQELEKKVKIQASQLDQVNFQVQYQNVPQRYMVASEYFTQYLKAVWWPYYVPSSEASPASYQGQSVSQTNNYHLQFNTRTQSFDLVIRKNNENIKFRHVPIPYPLNYFFPLSATREGMLELPKQIVGRPLYPECTLEGKWINTYDNRSSELPIDDCWHLMSGDCSPSKLWAVLVREQSSSSQAPKEVKIFLRKTEIKIIPSGRHSEYNPHLELFVNGTKLHVERGQVQKNIIGSDGQIVAQAKLSHDGAMGIYSVYVNVISDGQKVKTEASLFAKDQLCGLCGDYNDQKAADFRGPKKCVYSKPEVFAASYRIPSQSCRSLPQRIQQELEKESQQCAKYQEIPTKVVKSFEAHTGKCLQHHHELIEKHEKICFSRKPVTECSPRCRSESGSIVEKRVSFACLPKNRTAERYAEKVRQGQILRELEQLPESFALTMPLPKSCVPVSRSL